MGLTRYMPHRTRSVHGVYGASSMERLPVKIAIVEQMKQFKAIQFQK